MTTGVRFVPDRPRPAPGRCPGIVPPWLLQAMAANGDETQRQQALRSLAVDAVHRSRRRTAAAGGGGDASGAGAVGVAATDSAQRSIFTADGALDLPGRLVRTEGTPASGDLALDEAYDGLGATYDFYLDAYARHSIDDAGLPLEATVHYGTDYDNAFWDGTRMVFGDGDGDLFNRFTVSVDVVGHELTHGVTEHDAGLVYQGQPGALNESVSDVFGSLVKQHALGQAADQADWLIGAGLFTDRVAGVALRSMKAPGTAYDDPVLGRDPQPATMAGYVTTDEDDGGVHTNSGIPNHAFYLVATALGGHAWEVAGRIWYAALRDPALPDTATFADFAAATLRAAQARFGAGEVSAVRGGWEGVGVRTP